MQLTAVLVARGGRHGCSSAVRPSRCLGGEALCYMCSDRTILALYLLMLCSILRLQQLAARMMLVGATYTRTCYMCARQRARALHTLFVVLFKSKSQSTTVSLHSYTAVAHIYCSDNTHAACMMHVDARGGVGATGRVPDKQVPCQPRFFFCRSSCSKTSPVCSI